MNLHNIKIAFIEIQINSAYKSRVHIREAPLIQQCCYIKSTDSLKVGETHIHSRAQEFHRTHFKLIHEWRLQTVKWDTHALYICNVQCMRVFILIPIHLHGRIIFQILYYIYLIERFSAQYNVSLNVCMSVVCMFDSNFRYARTEHILQTKCIFRIWMWELVKPNHILHIHESSANTIANENSQMTMKIKGRKPLIEYIWFSHPLHQSINKLLLFSSRF